jgi:Ca2+-binding RTX toxin-like protein
VTMDVAGPGFVLSQDNIGSQSAPALTALPGGGFFAVWTSDVGGIQHIRARIILADGSPAGAEFTVAGNVMSPETQASLTRLADGSLAIAWIAAADGTPDLEARMFSATGAPLGDAFIIGSSATAASGNPVLTALAGGGFVAVWTGDLAGNPAIRGRLFAADGAAGDEFAVAGTDPGAETFPTVAALPGGGFAVAWQQPAADLDIRLRVFDSAALPTGPDVVVNTLQLGAQANPAMSVLADGSIIVVWQSLENGDLCLRARHLNAAGTPLADDFVISASADGQSTPAVAALPDGGFIVAWEEAVGGDFFDVFLRRFDAAGIAADPAIRAHTAQAGDQARPAFSLLTDGRLALAWQNADGAGDISGRIIDLRLRTAEGSVTVEGESFTPWLLSFGDVVSIAPLAMISVLNQHGLQTENAIAPGIAVNVQGRLEVSADQGSYDAIRLLATDTGQPGGIGGHSVEVSETGQVIAHAGSAVRLAGGQNAVTNAGLIQGAETSIIGGEGRDTIFNQGRIIGAVAMAGGDDVFDGRGGVVSGTIMGGAGDDLYVIADTTLNLSENFAEGRDRVQSYANFTLTANIETLELMGTLAISGTGNAAANTVTGNAAANRITAGGGADTLSGSAGADRLSGDGGSDRLKGGPGADILKGGTGADVFVFERASDSRGSSADAIVDFRSGQDKIDLARLMPADAGFVAEGAFTGDGPEVRFVATRKRLTVEIDLNGDARADMAIVLNGIAVISAKDFLF